MAGKYGLRIICQISVCLDKCKKILDHETYRKERTAGRYTVKTAPVVWKHKNLDIELLRTWSVRRACNNYLTNWDYLGETATHCKLEVSIPPVVRNECRINLRVTSKKLLLYATCKISWSCRKSSPFLNIATYSSPRSGDIKKRENVLYSTLGYAEDLKIC